MKHHFRAILFTVGFLILVSAVLAALRESSQKGVLPVEPNQETANLKLTSLAFEENGEIPIKYTCRGGNISLPLKAENLPPDSKAWAVIMHDPDAINGDWTHWTVWNIPNSSGELAENSIPASVVQGKTSSGETGYNGPCPPAGTGTHRYVFDIYALDDKLPVGAEVTREELQKAMSGHVIARASLIGKFSAE